MDNFKMTIYNSVGNEITSNSKYFVELQSPSIAYFSPGQWLPSMGIHNQNKSAVRWRCKSTTVPKVSAFLATCQSKGNFEVKAINETNIEIWFWTPKLQWLDIITIQISKDEGDVILDAESKSSALCPTSCPGALCFSLFYFWVPFLDHGKNLEHLQQLKKIVQNNGITIEEQISFNEMDRT